MPLPASTKVARGGGPLSGSGFGVQQLWNRYKPRRFMGYYNFAAIFAPAY
jgi:hypothetical protein